MGGADILMNVQHDRGRVLARTGGGGLVLTDTSTALEVRAELPETRESSTDTLALVAAGVLRGLSLEFQPLAERMEAGVRVITRARLAGLAVVDRPAYPASKVAARAEVETPNRWRELIL